MRGSVPPPLTFKHLVQENAQCTKYPSIDARKRIVDKLMSLFIQRMSASTHAFEQHKGPDHVLILIMLSTATFLKIAQDKHPGSTYNVFEELRNSIVYLNAKDVELLCEQDASVDCAWKNAQKNKHKYLSDMHVYISVFLGYDNDIPVFMRQMCVVCDTTDSDPTRLIFDSVQDVQYALEKFTGAKASRELAEQVFNEMNNMSMDEAKAITDSTTDISESEVAQGYSNLLRHVRKCSACHKLKVGLSKCTRCKKAYYCNRSCQKKHWRVHKKTCL